MENVVLIIHLLLALALIGVVLLQRSEGGLGAMGGGSSGSISARSAATGLGKLTWILAIAFICTSLTLTVIAAQNASGSSIMDRLSRGGGSAADAEEPGGIDAEGLLPPPSAGDTNLPLVPSAD